MTGRNASSMNYVALIRGIMPSNPVMSNANLCRVIKSLGYKNARALLSSGNVIFASGEQDEKAMAQKISAALQNKLGINGHTIVRSQKNLENLLAKKPFGDQAHTQTGNYQTVTFFVEPNEAEIMESSDARMVYKDDLTRCYQSTSGMTIMPLLEKAYGKTITTRTWKTVERIVKKMQEIPSDA